MIVWDKVLFVAVMGLEITFSWHKVWQPGPGMRINAEPLLQMKMSYNTIVGVAFRTYR